MNFAKASLINIFASGILVIIGMLISVLQARILGPQELGRFQLLITTQVFILTILSLGIGQSCIYFINSLKNPIKDVLSNAIKGIIPFAFISATVLSFVIYNLKSYFGEVELISLIVFSIGNFCLLLNYVFRPVLLAEFHVIQNQVVSFIGQVLFLSTLVLYVFKGYDINVDLLIFLTGAVNVVSFVFLYLFLKDKIHFSKKVDYKLLNKIIQWGIKLSGNNIAVIIMSSIPVYFIKIFAGSDGLSNVAYYSRASSLLVFGTIFCSSIGPLLYAKWTLIDKCFLRAKVKQVSSIFLLLNILIGFFLILFASFIIRLLYGEEYSPAIPLVRILAISLVFNSIKEVNYQILSCLGKPEKILINLVYGIIILVVLLLIVLPIYGLVGSVVAVLISNAITALMLCYQSRKISDIKIRDFFILPSVKQVSVILKLIINKNH